MAVFKPGQTVTYRGKSGIVEAVDRTPGMVDVRYGRLVKRHSASDLAQGAKSNPRRPRRSRRVKANPVSLQAPGRAETLNKLKLLIQKHEEAISYLKWEAVKADWARKSTAEKEKLLAAFEETAREVEREQGILRPRDIELLYVEEGVLATYPPLQEKWDKNGLPAVFAAREKEDERQFSRMRKAIQTERGAANAKTKDYNAEAKAANAKAKAYNKALAEDTPLTAKKKMRPLKPVPKLLSNKEARELAIARGFGPVPTFKTFVGMSVERLNSGLAKARVELKNMLSPPVTRFVFSPTSPPIADDEKKPTPAQQAQADAARETERIRRQSEATLIKRSAKVTPATVTRKPRIRVRSGERAPAYFSNAKVGFEARPDPPRFPVVGGIPQLNNLCGNPIDGTIYILAVKESGDGVRRDISRVTTVADIAAARDERKRLNNGVDDWDEMDAATQLNLVKEWLKGKGFYETYPRYKVNERTEKGRVKEPYSVEDTEYINQGGVFLTGRPRVRKARKSMTPKGRLQISGKSRSQGLFSKSQLPRETYFFPETEGEGNGFVALVAIKRVVAADEQLQEFQPRFPYGSSKRRSPFFAWQKLYRPFDTKATPAQGQLVCETLAGKDAREAAATLKFKLLPLKSALENVYRVAYTGQDQQGAPVKSGVVAKSIERLLNAMSLIGNDVLPVVELYIQSRKPGSIITKASITPQIAMVPAIVSFDQPDNSAGNPNMIPLSWFREAFTQGPVPLFTPNRALQANLDALLVTARGGTQSVGVEEIIRELLAGGSMPSPLKKNAFVCGGPGERTKVDDLDVLLAQVAFDNKDDMNDPEVAADVMAGIIQERYSDNFDSIAYYSEEPYAPLAADYLASNLLASGVFNRLERPKTSDRDVDAAIAAMKQRSPDRGPKYWKFVKDEILRQKGRQQSIDRQILEAATFARCRRGALYLYFSLGGPNLIKAIEGAVKNLDAVIDYGGEIDDYEQFRRKGKVNILLKAKPYAMTRKRADLGAQFYYTFNPALAVLTQKMWHTGSPFTEGDETKIDSAAQDMNMNVQQVGVYGAMLKASYENTALAQQAFDDLAEEGITDPDDDDYRRKLLSQLTLQSTDQALLVARLGVLMKEKLPTLYGKLGTVVQARGLMQASVEDQRRVLRVIEQVQKATRQGGQVDRRTAGLPYQDRTITDRDMSRLLADFAVLYMAMGDDARRYLSRGDKDGLFGSLSMSLSPEMSRQALSRARQRAEKAIHSASAFGSRAFQRYTERKDRRRESLGGDLAAAREDLQNRGLGQKEINDILQQHEKAVESDPPFAGESLGPVSIDSPRHSARNRLTGVKRDEPSYFPQSSPLAALETGSSDAKEVETLLKSLLKGSIDPFEITPNPRSRRPRRKKR